MLKYEWRPGLAFDDQDAHLQLQDLQQASLILPRINQLEHELDLQNNNYYARLADNDVDSEDDSPSQGKMDPMAPPRLAPGVHIFQIRVLSLRTLKYGMTPFNSNGTSKSVPPSLSIRIECVLKRSYCLGVSLTLTPYAHIWLGLIKEQVNLSPKINCSCITSSTVSPFLVSSTAYATVPIGIFVTLLDSEEKG